MSGSKRINLKSIRTYPISDRKTKSEISSFAKVPSGNWDINDFLEGLPDYLKANEIRDLIDDIRAARTKNKASILMMGAHSLKLGLAPVIIDMIDSGFISHIAVNGAVLIHDYEFAFYGRSSEDVAETLCKGMFGMAAETPEYLNSVVSEADDDASLGEVVGKAFIKSNPENLSVSVVGNAVRKNIPVTAHIAVGADTIHQHPSFDSAKWGKLSGNDFLILAESCKDLDNGGIVINLGSAVILPEVFLKAFNLARNIHGKISDFSAANIDMIQHYRPVTNVVSRPTDSGGRKYTITGHFEILLPLIAWALKA